MEAISCSLSGDGMGHGMDSLLVEYVTAGNVCTSMSTGSTHSNVAETSQHTMYPVYILAAIPVMHYTQTTMKVPLPHIYAGRLSPTTRGGCPSYLTLGLPR